MRLSNKSTFSLICLVLLFAFAAMPAMAATIEAEWTTDVNNDGTAGDNGWVVTATAADGANVTAVPVNILQINNAADTDTAAGVRTALATGVVVVEVPAVAGQRITVQVVVEGGTDAGTYQRVLLPASADLASTTLVKLPMLMKLATPMYYLNFANNEATVMFNFAAAGTGNGAVGSVRIHETDVTLTPDTNWVVTATTATTVTVRSSHERLATSTSSTVTLGANYAQPATTATDGVATIFYDDTAPATPASVTVSALPGNFSPLDEIWDEPFLLTFAVTDEASGSGVALPMVSGPADKVMIGDVGLNPDGDDAGDGDDADATPPLTGYGVRVTPLDTRTTTAGEEITLTITPMDKAGNAGIAAMQRVKLAAKTQTPNRAPAFASGAAISDITATAGTAITSVTLPAATDPDSGDTLTYSITPAVGNGLMFDAATRVLSGTPTAMMAQTMYTYMVSDGALSDTLTFNITVNAAPVATDTGDNISPVITIPAAASEGSHNSNGIGSFVVVVRDSSATGADGLAFRDDVMVVEWPDMPDLERLFYTGNDGIILGGGGGGALILTESVTHAGDDLAPGTVGISEIMWGIDANFLGEDKEDASQWIELHNLNAAEVKVILSWKTGRDITDDSSITGNLAHPKLDVVTNFFNDRPGSARWEVPGSNGASAGGINFVSMARKGTFSKLRRHENKTDKPFNSRYTRTGGAENSRDGRSSGQWAASSAAYLRLRTTLSDQTDVVYEYVGTPGRVNTFTAESQPHIRASRRDVPASPVIFNEIANRADSHSRYEWIELRNVTDGKVNLRNWLISIVTSNSSDAVFYQFPNNNNAQIEPQGVLLLVASDPRDNSDHPLAVGWNVDVNAEDQPRGLAELGISGSSKHGRYKVADTGAAGMFGGDRSGLPDDGKFVLILRSQDNHDGQRSGVDGGKGVAETGNNDLNRVVDVAGWDDNVAKNSYPNPVSSTGLWPLHQTRGTFSHNRLDADKVHYRRHRTTPDGMAGAGAAENKNEGGKAAYARGVGYTGIGYKRQAMDSGVHGGDPGYHGVTRNSAHDNDGGPRVYISEVMLSQGNSRTKLPQWIELYNASDYAINLSGGDGVGWRLVIENPDDPIRTINFRSKGNVKTINPKQTVLVVSASARSIGSDHLPAGTVFPDTRVFNVYKELKGHFEMAGRTSAIINPTAFNIKLIDGGKKVNNVVTYTTSDEIGNLDGNARTNDQGMWEYPESVTEDGYRSSLIRIFDGGTPREGLSMDASNVKPLGGTAGEGVDGMDGIDMKYSWVHAADTDFVDIFVRHTWYGSENDFGTPANRAAQVLPVELSYFRPALEDGEVAVRWTTESELNNAGFNIYRSETRDGEYKQVNTELIAGNGTTGERNTYKWVDPTAKPGVAYYYQIEDVSFAGEREALAITKLKGLISAKNKLTTRWGELKSQD